MSQQLRSVWFMSLDEENLRLVVKRPSSGSISSLDDFLVAISFEISFFCEQIVLVRAGGLFRGC